jgi:hypothetical protein
MVARARRDIREHFEGHDAFAAERPVAYQPPDRIHRLQFEALIRRGIIQPGGQGTYWFDRDRERAEEERQRAAAIVVLKIVLIGVAIGVATVAIMSWMR